MSRLLSLPQCTVCSAKEGVTKGGTVVHCNRRGKRQGEGERKNNCSLQKVRKREKSIKEKGEKAKWKRRQAQGRKQ
jgi:hypothetical protein